MASLGSLKTVFRDDEPAPPAEDAIDIGKKRLEGMIRVQTDLFDELQESSAYWWDRAQLEAKMAATIVAHLAAARSVPEAMAAGQEWTAHRLQTMAEDGQHLVADAQRWAQMAMRMFPGPADSTGADGVIGGT